MSEKPDNEEENLAEGTLLSHLIELRSRLLKAVAAIVIVLVPLVPFSQRIFEIITKPLRAVIPSGQLLATKPLSPIFTPFKAVCLVAIFLAMPYVLYQAWAFVAPGLYRKEKRFALPLLATSIFLFYAGVAFAYFVVFPLIFGFAVTFPSDTINVMPDISEYLDLAITLVLAFGCTFEVPIATVLLVMTGITTVDKLSKARPYVFLMAFVVGMFLTPPDVFSQTLLAIPVYLLYEAGIVMSRIFVRKQAESAAATTENP
ncbi:MAG: twin-arginine translocase subunit TatC [Woeseiaceae bacterium]